MNFEIVPFTNKHDREGFHCGVPELDQYLMRQASQDVKKSYATLFVAVDEETQKILGYYTLSNTGIDIKDIPLAIRKRLPKYPDVPAIRLGRLAVDVSMQGQGLGAELLADAVIRSVLNTSAWAIMVVDAKDSQARAFYCKFGFEPLLDDENHLYAMRQDLEQYFDTKK